MDDLLNKESQMEEKPAKEELQTEQEIENLQTAHY